MNLYRDLSVYAPLLSWWWPFVMVVQVSFFFRSSIMISQKADRRLDC